MSQPAPRSRRPVMVGLLVATAGAGATAAAPWWQVRIQSLTASFSGGESSGGAAVLLVLAAAAGILVLLAAGRRGKQVMGGLLGILFAIIAVLGFSGPQPSPAEVEARVQTLTLATDVELLRTAFSALYGVAGVVGLTAAIGLIVAAPRWPDRSSRYQTSRYQRLAADPTDDPESWWQVLDAGEDPTATAPNDGNKDPDARHSDHLTKPDVEQQSAAGSTAPDYPSGPPTRQNGPQGSLGDPEVTEHGGRTGGPPA